MKHAKKIFALTLTLMLLLSVISVHAAEIVDSGACGDNLTWTLDSDGLLTISGTGKMTENPWCNSYKGQIKKVIINKGVTSIGESAFVECTGLTSVTIPNSVTNIGNFAFYGCSGLTNVTIPNSVTSIGGSAFYLCSGLTSVTIPNSVTSIGESAFAHCSDLTSVTIPNSVKSIGEAVFYSCMGLTSVTLPDSVTSIGESAFAHCSDLTSVTIPISVTSIGDQAFYGCTGLTSMMIPDSVTNIGHSAFESCRGLTSVTIGNSVTSIGDSVFMYCSELTSVTIGNSVTSIGERVFSDCTGLTNLTVSAGNKTYHSAGNSIIETESKTLIIGCKTSDIPSDGSVTSIGEGAFSGCTGLTSVTIPDSVTSIGEGAFSGCTGLTSVTIPDSVTSIGEYAFYGCTGLTSVTIPNGVTSIGACAFSGCSSLTSVAIPNSVTSIGDDTFLGCTGLMSVTIGNSVTSIGDNAFRDCTGLTSVTIPDSVKSIGVYAFCDCTGLTSVTIGNSVTSIGEGVFFGCDGLTSMTVASKNTVYHSAGNCVIETESKNLIVGCKTSVIPTDGSVTSIGDWAFSECTSLTSVMIPDSVTNIGNSAFFGCTGLEEINVDSKNPVYFSAGNCLIETESKTLINGCKNSVIPTDGSVTSISKSAFSRCTGLTSVMIPNSVTSIGDWAFSECTSLTSVMIPDSVTSIGDWAFSECTSLTSVMIPNSVTSIGDGAFDESAGLTSVIIPVNVTEIGWDAIPEQTVIYGTAGSYAQEWAKENDRAFLLLNEAQITLNAPPVVNDAAADVYGLATPGAKVTLTVNGKAAGTAEAAANGRWSAKLAFAGAKDGDSFTVKASVTVNGKTAEKTAKVTYSPNAVVLEDFNMTHSYYSAHVSGDNMGIAKRNFTVVPGSPFSFKILVSNAKRAKELSVVSTKNGKSKKLALTYDAASGNWLASGFFDPADKNYVPGVLTVEGVDKDGAAFTTGAEFRFNFLVDPSGYAYEAVKSNVLAGVTAAIYYKDADGHELLWNAETADQINPVTTLLDGAFAWVVPEGQWQVRLSKDGYEDAASEWMDVPPEHTNVYLPMVRYDDPEVQTVNIYADHADVIFDSYMDIGSVNAETVAFAGYTGKLTPVDKTETEKGSGVFYATTFRFTPNKSFSGTVDVHIDGVKNYAGKESYGYTKSVTVTAEPKNLTATDKLSVDFGKTATVELNAENAAGKTVTVSADNVLLTLAADTVTLDENGKGTLELTAAMPGETTLTFALDGTTLTAKTTVTVQIPVPAPAVLAGDVSGDGAVSAEDARLALRGAVGLETYAPGSAEFLAADADKNGTLEAADARLILRRAVGFVDPEFIA